MARTFEITDTAQTKSFDMQGADADRVAGSRYWTLDGERTTEIWDVVIQDTAANIRTAIQTLTDLAAMVREWKRDKLTQSEIVLNWRTDGEDIKFAFIHNLEIQALDTIVNDIDLEHATATYRIAITRDTAWRSNTALTNVVSGTISALGGQWDLSSVRSGGDFPAHLGMTTVQVDTTGTMDKIWIGIHPVREWGTPITTLLELEDGTMGTDTSSVSDGNASGGNAAECTFVTEQGMAHRVTRAFDGGIDHSQSGYYHVLLRARLDNSNTIAGIRMSLGFLAFGSQVPHATFTTQYIDGANYGTLYAIIPMGTIMLPPMGLREPFGELSASEGSFWSNIRLHFEAQQIAGSGKLRFDAVALIPAEHSLFIDKAQLIDGDFVTALIDREGNVSAITENLARTNFSNFPIISDAGMYPYAYPREGGILVVAGQRENNSYIGDHFDYLTIDELRYSHNLYI